MRGFPDNRRAPPTHSFSQHQYETSIRARSRSPQRPFKDPNAHQLFPQRCEPFATGNQRHSTQRYKPNFNYSERQGYNNEPLWERQNIARDFERNYNNGLRNYEVERMAGRLQERESEFQSTLNNIHNNSRSNFSNQNRSRAPDVLYQNNYGGQSNQQSEWQSVLNRRTDFSNPLNSEGNSNRNFQFQESLRSMDIVMQSNFGSNIKRGNQPNSPRNPSYSSIGNPTFVGSNNAYGKLICGTGNRMDRDLQPNFRSTASSFVTRNNPYKRPNNPPNKPTNSAYKFIKKPNQPATNKSQNGDVTSRTVAAKNANVLPSKPVVKAAPQKTGNKAVPQKSTISATKVVPEKPANPATKAVPKKPTAPVTKTAVQKPATPVTKTAVQKPATPVSKTTVQKATTPVTKTAIQKPATSGTKTAVQKPATPVTKTAVQKPAAPVTKTAVQKPATSGTKVTEVKNFRVKPPKIVNTYAKDNLWEKWWNDNGWIQEKLFVVDKKDPAIQSVFVFKHSGPKLYHAVGMRFAYGYKVLNTCRIAYNKGRRRFVVSVYTFFKQYYALTDPSLRKHLAPKHEQKLRNIKKQINDEKMIDFINKLVKKFTDIYNTIQQGKAAPETQRFYENRVFHYIVKRALDDMKKIQARDVAQYAREIEAEKKAVELDAAEKEIEPTNAEVAAEKETDQTINEEVIPEEIKKAEKAVTVEEGMVIENDKE